MGSIWTCIRSCDSVHAWSCREYRESFARARLLYDACNRALLRAINSVVTLITARKKIYAPGTRARACTHLIHYYLSLVRIFIALPPRINSPFFTTELSIPLYILRSTCDLLIKTCFQFRSAYVMSLFSYRLRLGDYTISKMKWIYIYIQLKHLK